MNNCEEEFQLEDSKLKSRFSGFLIWLLCHYVRKKNLDNEAKDCHWNLLKTSNSVIYVY